MKFQNNVIKSFLFYGLIFLAYPAAEANAAGTHVIRVGRGWNLISLPARVDNGNTSDLFPQAMTEAYSYIGKSYTSQDTLTTGRAYWIKFDSAEVISIQGNALLQDTITVDPGWNLVSALAMPTAVSDVRTNPPDVIASPFYSYVPGQGYREEDTLQPGRGYWVKVNQSGQIVPVWNGVIFNDSTIQPETIPGFQSVFVDSNQLLFTYASSGDLPVFHPGQVLFGMSDSGYARKVISSAPNGNQLIVQTENATLDEIVQYANIDTSFVLTFPDTAEMRRMYSAPLHYEKIIDGRKYTVTSLKPEISMSPDGSVFSWTFPNFAIEATLGGSFQFSASTSALTVSIPAPVFRNTLQLNEEEELARFVVDFAPSFQLDELKLSASGIVDRNEKVQLLGPFSMGRIISPYVLGMIEFEFTLYAGCQGQIVASGQMKSAGNVNVQTSVTAGIQLDGEVTEIWEPSMTATMESGFKAAGEFTTSIKPYIQPTFELIWNRSATVGIFGKLFGYFDVTAPPFEIETGVGASGGAEAAFRLMFGREDIANAALTLGEKKWSLWSTKGPDQPKNPIPADLSVGIQDTVTLQWTGKHPTNAPLRYDVYLGTVNPPQSLVSAYESDTSYFADDLLPETDYYWKIEACDEDDDTAVSPIWKFTTGLFRPKAPILVSPSNGSVDQPRSPVLLWRSSVGATSYRLQVSEDSLFASPIRDQDPVVDTSRQITGLADTTTYFWRVNAMNSVGVSEWSSAWSFKTDLPCPSGITYAGKTYNTVLIGSQCWMTENLDVGTRVAGVDTQTNNNIIEKYCPANNPDLCATYGGLYLWNEAMAYSTTNGSRGICPPGWHIPTNGEWQILSNAVGGSSNALKSTVSGSGAGAGTNTSGFSALLAGNRQSNGNIVQLGYWTYLWSSTSYESPPNGFFGGGMLFGWDSDDLLVRTSMATVSRDGMSVRCIKN